MHVSVKRVWVRASEWARDNFGCDAHTPEGDRCGRPIAWVIALADGAGPELGVCHKHRGDQLMAEWHSNIHEVLSFASALVEGGSFGIGKDETGAMRDLLYLIEKPWKYDPEYKQWVEAGKPDRFDPFAEGGNRGSE